MNDLKTVLKILSVKKGITFAEIAERAGSTRQAVSNAVSRASIAPQKTVAEIMDALQCHAEVVIVDDVTGERYKLD